MAYLPIPPRGLLPYGVNLLDPAQFAATPRQNAAPPTPPGPPLPPGLLAPENSSDGNVGQNSPQQGAPGTGVGIGGMGGSTAANIGLGVLGMVPGPIGMIATAVNGVRGLVNMISDAQNAPATGLDSAIGATAQSATQTANPGSVQSPGDEGIADGMANDAGTQSPGSGGSTGVDDPSDGDAGWRTGGPIPGDGDGDLEAVRIKAHEGEYVIRPEAVKKYGHGLLGAINAGKMSKRGLLGMMK